MQPLYTLSRIGQDSMLFGLQTRLMGVSSVGLTSLMVWLLAGGMLAFALSFDEIVVTTFTSGQQETLPIWMLEELAQPYVVIRYQRDNATRLAPPELTRNGRCVLCPL
jgi:hypothetical protein